MRGLFLRVISNQLSVIKPPTGLVPVEADVELEGCARPRSTSFTTGTRPVGSGHFSLTRAAEHRTRAFTLVEIALAMLAFSLGIMSFFSLLSLGMSQGMEAQEHTRAAEFADSTLRGLRAVSDHLSETSKSNEWARFWQDLGNGSTNLIVAAGGDDGIWYPPPVIWGNNRDRTIVFTNHPLREVSVSDVVNHALRYRMRVETTNTLPTIPHVNLAIVTLRVWEGESGRSADDEALIFYTHFTDRGAVQ